MGLIGLGVLALALAFGVAWLSTRMAGLIWVGANFLGYQWAVEATRPGPEQVEFAANVALVMLVAYLSVMALSGIAAAWLAKTRARGASA